jgi:hypothetical protein
VLVLGYTRSSMVRALLIYLTFVLVSDFSPLAEVAERQTR